MKNNIYKNFPIDKTPYKIHIKKYRMVKNNNATKTDIRSLKAYIKRLEKNTKADVKELKTDVGSLKTNMKILENKFDNLKTDMLEMKVEILGELKDMREESAAHNFSHMRINDDLQNHDEQIKKLETATV
ncbi:hypothetical protein A2Z22_00445 [Candidatus Woesebacteria bacterium RBG_16_34_12]|uniref:Uncharacterized protein n=1 Tax=Candidatus Woesebacteria bacterium RBG_16_34_12 TaxID=1802480 RepID=A0A1F7X906_9BACT|nr:MAG: hypothetical protein A2Z22_00445 [Candidatus Woesebacteria bacterium RBG_16_34_12]